MRVYVGELNILPIHELRGDPTEYADMPNPDHYGASHTFGAEIRDAGSWRILCPGVRDPDGQCAALFRPKALGPVYQAEHLAIFGTARQSCTWSSCGPSGCLGGDLGARAQPPSMRFVPHGILLALRPLTKCFNDLGIAMVELNYIAGF